MTDTTANFWDELSTPSQQETLARLARRRGWGPALLLVGGLHLAAFLGCWAMTLHDYHDAAGYLAVWLAEAIGVALILRGATRPDDPPLCRFLARVWVAYLLLAFNLCSMNALAGHDRFALFPATASLASFGFLVMTFAVHRRFFAAVLVLFASGLLMAAYPRHAYLVFALAWCAVLVGTGVTLSPSRS